MDLEAQQLAAAEAAEAAAEAAEAAAEAALAAAQGLVAALGPLPPLKRLRQPTPH